MSRSSSTDCWTESIHKRLIFLVSLFVCNTLLTCVVEYVPSNCFIERFRAAVSVLVGPCCPALLNIVLM